MITRLVVRPLLAGLLALLATWGPMTGAGGQEGGAPTPLTVSKEAFYTSKIVGSLPPVLVKQVPPAPVCLVVSQVCGAEVDALKAALGLNAGVPLPDVPDFMLPQPVEPGTLPVGMYGGATRYTSALKFDLPAIPDDALVEQFDLVIQEADLTFSIESPAFRAAVLAGLAQYPNPQPEVLQNYLAGVADGTTTLAAFEPSGIEVCLLRAAFDAGPSQDPAKRPAADCIVGSVGTRDTAAGTWTFDISAIVQEWVDGAPNEGIHLGPLGAQNVAYGDPDPSTNFVVSLVTTADPAAGPKAVVATGEKPPELVDLPISSELGDAVGDAGGVVDNVSAFGAALGNPPVSGGGSTSAPEAAAASRPGPDGKGSTAWWVWLLIPLGAAGSYALAQALDASPAVQSRRAGAMTRLVTARGRFPADTGH